jgi:hypothetical protein
MSALAVLVSSAILAACPVSHVHYGLDTKAEPSLHGVPWIATSNGAFAGHLFYWGSTAWGRKRMLGARIFTTQRSHPVHPKVLWLARHGAHRGSLVIRGRRLDAAGSFRTSFGNRGTYDFPSYVEIPAPGCWRVTVTAGGASGSVVFAALP